MSVEIRQLFDSETWTYTYMLSSQNEAVIIDPVDRQIERDLRVIEELGCELRYSLDTHVHADHITASGLLREKTGCRCIGSKNGASCVDTQAGEGDVFSFGDASLQVLETPGHTSDSLSYLVGGNVFTGDTLFVRGCGRTDFQNGDARALYASVHNKLFTLPEQTKIWPGHDYRGHTQSTVGEEKAHNPRLAGKSESEFVALMAALRLPRPKFIDVAVPANRVCGRMDGPSEGEDSSAPGVDVVEVLSRPRHQWPRIVDVRRLDEWKEDHVIGVEHIPLDQLESAADGWPRGEALYFLCRSGNRSGKAAALLRSKGFGVCVNLLGGMLRVREQFAQGEL